MIKRILIFVLLLSGSLTAQIKNKIIIDKVTDKPMLIGLSGRKAFSDSAFSWWFNSQYNFYNIDSTTLNKIKDKIKNYDLTIVMGTWCSDSRREVPRIYKILDYLKYPEKQLTLITVNRKLQAPGTIVKKLNIKRVPDLIVYKDKTEIGRIIEHPKKSLEKDLAAIINKKAEVKRVSK